MEGLVQFCCELPSLFANHVHLGHILKAQAAVLSVPCVQWEHLHLPLDRLVANHVQEDHMLWYQDIYYVEHALQVNTLQ